MKVMLTGASGFIGQRLHQALAAARHEVLPVSRRHGVDMLQRLEPAAWRPLLQGVQAVVNAAGQIAPSRGQGFDALHTRAPGALFQACVEAGVPRVVQISALGAASDAPTAFLRSKHAADALLHRLPLQACVLRPSLVQGAGGGSATWLMRLAATPFVAVPGDGSAQVQPLHVDDLVETVTRLLAEEAMPRTLDMVGPEAMGFGNWLLRLRAAQGLPPARLLHVPLRVALALATFGQVASPLLRPDNLRMLLAGSTADVRPLAAFLGRMPHPAISAIPTAAPCRTRSAA